MRKYTVSQINMLLVTEASFTTQHACAYRCPWVKHVKAYQTLMEHFKNLSWKVSNLVMFADILNTRDGGITHTSNMRASNSADEFMQIQIYCCKVTAQTYVIFLHTSLNMCFK